MKKMLDFIVGLCYNSPARRNQIYKVFLDVFSSCVGQKFANVLEIVSNCYEFGTDCQTITRKFDNFKVKNQGIRIKKGTSSKEKNY